MGTSEKKTKKLIALATYAIAVICLLLGLFLPLFGGKGILALQLPNVFMNLAQKPQTDLGKPFALPYPVMFMGKGKPFDFMAFVIMLYAAVTFVSLLMLIPIGITFRKQSNAGVLIAYGVEIAAALVLSLYFIIVIGNMPETKISYNMLIAFGGALAMLAIQSLADKKLTGFVKLVLLLLSVAAVSFLFGFWTTGKLGAKYLQLADKLKCTPLLMGVSVESTDGYGFVKIFFEAPFKDFLVGPAKVKAALCLGVIVSLIVLVNFFIDIIGLATDAKRKGLIFNVARYLLEALAVVATFITAAVCKYQPALLLCLILIVSFVQLLISGVRVALAFLSGRKKEQKPVQAYFAEPVPTAQSDYPVYPENHNASPFPYPPAVYSAPEDGDDLLAVNNDYNEPEPQPYTLRDFKPAEEYRPVPPPVEPLTDYVAPPQAQPPRTVASEPYAPEAFKPTYQGPTDEFLRKLNNNEKTEFSMIFIEKSKGDVGKVPDYIIGGDNKKFFSAVFIYLGRMRSIVSDGLLNKMYKELNMLQ